MLVGLYSQVGGAVVIVGLYSQVGGAVVLVGLYTRWEVGQAVVLV